MTNEEKQQLGEALRRHTEESLGKRGWSKGAIAVVGAVIASLIAFWCSSCSGMPVLKLELPTYGELHVIKKERSK